MAGNPVLGFLQTQPVGDDARTTVTKCLRWLGIAMLVGFAITVLNAVLTIAMGDTYGGSDAIAVGSAIGGVVFSLVVTGLVCWWITYAIGAWSSGNPSGAMHALIIGLLAAIFGGLGVLLNLAGVGASALYGSGIPVMYTVVNAIGVLMTAAECVLGILILVNRGKAMAPTGTRGTTTRN